MATENEEEVVLDENLDASDDTEDTEDTTDWKAEAQTLRDKAIAQRERTRLLKQELADTKRAMGIANAKPSKTGDLDETQLDYLDLKGITDEEDIKILTRHVQKTGETVRQALKDDYIIAKLEANAKTRETKGATPSATKRGGNQVNDVASALARFEQTGELPTDFALKSQVVNAMSDKGNSKKPSWG